MNAGALQWLAFGAKVSGLQIHQTVRHRRERFSQKLRLGSTQGCIGEPPVQPLRWELLWIFPLSQAFPVELEAAGRLGGRILLVGRD